ELESSVAIPVQSHACFSCLTGIGEEWRHKKHVLEFDALIERAFGQGSAGHLHVARAGKDRPSKGCADDDRAAMPTPLHGPQPIATTRASRRLTAKASRNALAAA